MMLIRGSQPSNPVKCDRSYGEACLLGGEATGRMISGSLPLFVPNAWFHFLTTSRKCEKLTKKWAPVVIRTQAWIRKSVL
jgi:hypothetical protein